MRKIILLMCSFCIVSAGCINKEISSVPQTDQTYSEPDIMKKQEEDSLSGQEGAVIETVQSTFEISYFYQTTEELANDSELIVYGEVEDCSFYVHNGTVYNTRKIKIIETFKGQVEEGELISVYDIGGKCRITDFINSYETADLREYWSDYMSKYHTKDEINTCFIQDIPDGYFTPEQGDRSILFLKARSAENRLFERTGGWQGEYTEVENGLFRGPSTVSEISDQEEIKQIKTVSYDELKNMLSF